MKRFLCALLIALAGALATQSVGAQTKPAAKNGNTAPASVEETIRSRVEQRFNAKPTSVKRMPFGLWEIVIGSEVAYVDQNVDFLFVGRVVDAKTKDDLTQQRRDELMTVDYKALPFDLAVKTVRGDGSRQFAVFADPNCPYCKKFERDLVNMKNVTIYTFLYPILSQDSFERSRGVWCAKDRAAAWNDLMLDGKVPPAAPADCKHPLQQTLALGQKLEVTGTPTIVFTDGRRLPGAVPAERIEAGLTRAAAQK